MSLPSHSAYEIKADISLSAKEAQEVIIFLKKQAYQPHFHNPFWPELFEPYKTPLYIRFYEEGKLSGFFILYSVWSLSILWYSPLVTNADRVPGYINKIIEYLETKKIGLLKIVPLNNAFDIIPYVIENTELKARVSFEKKGRSTIRIPVANRMMEDIFRDFSKGHKSSIKRAQKEGLEAVMLVDKKHIEQFSRIYDDMHNRKGLILPLKDSGIAFDKIFDLKLGIFIGVFGNNNLLGGLVGVSEGNSLLYKFGASDVKYHTTPVLHVAILKLIEYAMETKHEIVDLGGYTPDAKSGSSSSGINLFKKGFGGEIVEYRPAVLIRINFSRWLFYSIVVYLSKMIPLPLKKIIYARR